MQRRGCGNEGPQHLFLTAADGRQTEGDVLTAGGLMDDDAAEETGDGRDTEGAQVKRAPPAHGDGILGFGDEGVEGVEVVILAPQRHDDDTAEQDGGGRSYGASGPVPDEVLRTVHRGQREAGHRPETAP